MAYKFNVTLPGLEKNVPVKEITAKQYRELVKSLYNKDGDVFLEHINSIIEDTVPGILQEQLTVVDYLILLLTSRMICINPDIKFNSTCPDTKKQFESIIRMEDIINKLSTVKSKNVFTKNAYKITYSLLKANNIIPVYKLDRQLEMYYHFISSIDEIQINEQIFNICSLPFNKKIIIIENLPIEISNKIYSDLIANYKEINKLTLFEIKSPYTKKVIFDNVLKITVEDVFELLKLLFNDDLSNIYKLSYNLVSMAGYTPEYLDCITPAEQFLYWSLHLQRVNKENESNKEDSKQPLPSYDGLNLPSRKKNSQSEFTVEN